MFVVFNDRSRLCNSAGHGLVPLKGDQVLAGGDCLSVLHNYFNQDHFILLKRSFEVMSTYQPP